MLKLQEGQYVRLIGMEVKNENDIYIVDCDYTKEDPRYSVVCNEYCLKKVKLNGEKKESGYTIFFYNEYEEKKNPNMDIKIITDLKVGKKEVNNYLKNRSDNEIIVTFEKSENQEIKDGSIVKFSEGIKFGVFGNKYVGTKCLWKVTFRKDGKRIMITELGKKGQELSNSRVYGADEGLSQLFLSKMIVMDKIETKKGDIKKESVENKETKKEVAKEEVKTITNTENNNNFGSYTIEGSVHTKTQETIYLVKFENKLSKDEYIQLNNTIKSIGGYYSKFTHSFVFKEDPINVLSDTFKTNTEVEEAKEIESKQQENNISIDDDYLDLTNISLNNINDLISLIGNIKEIPKDIINYIKNNCDSWYTNGTQELIIYKDNKTLFDCGIYILNHKIHIQSIGGDNLLQWNINNEFTINNLNSNEIIKPDFDNVEIKDISNKNIFVKCLIPSLNKTATIKETQEAINNSSTLEKIQVDKIVILKEDQYNYFVNHLLTDYDFLKDCKESALIYCYHKDSIVIIPAVYGYCIYTCQLVEDINYKLSHEIKLQYDKTYLNKMILKFDNNSLYPIHCDFKTIKEDNSIIYHNELCKSYITGFKLKKRILNGESVNIKYALNNKVNDINYFKDRLLRIDQGLIQEIFPTKEKRELMKIKFYDRLIQQLKEVA